jgi:hypothetical protein
MSSSKMAEDLRSSDEVLRYVETQYPELRQGLGPDFVRMTIAALRSKEIKRSPSVSCLCHVVYARSSIDAWAQKNFYW